MSKRTWNQLSSSCRRAANRLKKGFSNSWVELWDRLRIQSPGRLWSTFRSYAKQPSPSCTATPDEQWSHWASQGNACEPAWNELEKTDARNLVDWIRFLPQSEVSLPGTCVDETLAAASRLRAGRGVGIDGLSTDYLKKMPQ
eukprot:3052847-Karenia_brevis.AAC.1